MTRVILIILTILAGASAAMGQGMLLVYDGRSDDEAAKVSEADIRVIKAQALPAARRAWGDECDEEAGFVAAAEGSFTSAAKQRAVLYRYCETGHGFANNGLVILENGKVVKNIVYNGGSDNSLKAVPDINGNGTWELAIGGGSTNQGYTRSVVSLIEIAGGRGVTSFGDADIYEDDCGAREKCRMTAYAIYAKKVGRKTSYFRETFRKTGAKWQKVVAAKPLTLRKSPQEPPIVYRILN